MIRASRIAATALLALGGLGVSAHTASALAPTADPVPVSGLLHNLAQPITAGPVKTAFAQLDGMNINVGQLLA
ncbi:hypothetical protein AB0D27_35645 [Streptomyces sp. NPDC048415]|jgi:hypothetical protein|uniref:hypothetical protein n=1 Tax=Streptomyces sp. NPDC048415 TaxID=3154822 RepID=UPI0034226DEA